MHVRGNRKPNLQAKNTSDANISTHSPSITLIFFFPAVLNGVEYSSLTFGSAPACNSNFIALKDSEGGRIEHFTRTPAGGGGGRYYRSFQQYSINHRKLSNYGRYQVFAEGKLVKIGRGGGYMHSCKQDEVGMQWV